MGRLCQKLHAAILLALLTTGSLLAAVPHAISYQGRLTDPQGDPVTDGVYSILFRIYDSEEGGNVIWSSFGSVPLFVTDGLFAHLLGSTNPIPDSLADQDSLWLGLTVGLDEELTPRTLLSSVPFALKSSSAEFAVSASRADTSLYADTTAYATVAQTVLRDRDLYHQILDVNPNSTTELPFIVHDEASTVVLYIYGSGYQGSLAAHTHGGNNSHTHDITGTVGSTSVDHSHSFSGTTSSSGSAHTHSGTTSAYNLAHTHSGTTSAYNLAHSHSGTTNKDGAHHHNFIFGGYQDGLYLVHRSAPDDLTGQGTWDATVTGSVAPAESDHQHGFTTGSWGGNHTHNFTTSSWGSSHTHTITTGNASASHAHTFSGSTGVESIMHSHSFNGTALAFGSGLETIGISPGSMLGALTIYVDGVEVAGPFSGDFTSGELDLSAYVTGVGEHLIELKEEGGSGGRLTYNLFVQ